LFPTTDSSIIWRSAGKFRQMPSLCEPILSNPCQFAISNHAIPWHRLRTRYDAAWVAFHRVPYMWEPEFAADPNGLARVAAYQAGAAQPCFAPLRARASGSHGSAASTTAASRNGGGVNGGGYAPSGGLSPPPSEAAFSFVAPPPLGPAAAAAAATGLDLLPAALFTRAAATWATAPTAAAVALTVHVPRGAVGRIIGAGGQNIRALEDATGAKVPPKPACRFNERGAILLQTNPFSCRTVCVVAKLFIEISYS
jgi:hypothetical protein